MTTWLSKQDKACMDIAHAFTTAAAALHTTAQRF
jgi:hypothetical protein